MKLTIVIPAYNEEEAIASTIERTLAAVPEIISQTFINKVNIVVVSDGSHDRTAVIASGYKGIQLIAYEKNRGYGAALKLGFAQTDDEFVSFLDADGTCDPLFFIPLLKTQQATNADIVLGSRLGEGSEMPKIRRLGNIVFATLINLWAGTKIKDSASGMRIMKRNSIESLYPLPDGLHFTPAMSSKALFNKRIIIEEIPMPYKERMGESKLKVVRDGIRFLRSILEAAISYKPKRAFNVIAILFLVTASLLCISPLAFYINNNSVPDDSIYRLITIVLLGNVGVLLLGIGFAAQRFLDLLHYHELVNKGSLNKIENLIINHGLLSGLISLIIAAILFYIPLMQLFHTAHIQVSWTRVMMGSFFFMLGFQLICFGTLGIIVNTLLLNIKDKKK